MKKNKGYGLASALIIVASQVISSFKSSQDISGEIEKFRHEFQQSLIDRETYFVRKTELASIGRKIDILNNKMIRMNERFKELRPPDILTSYSCLPKPPLSLWKGDNNERNITRSSYQTRRY